MVGTQHADGGVTPPDVDMLVEGIRKLLDAAQTLRQMGATEVPLLPPRLIQVCREVLEEVDASPRSRSAASHDSLHRRPVASQSEVNDALRDMPLRRLLLQVISPGETFTVPEIVARLAKLGKQIDPAKVSNALGYQVARKQFVRERKGLYTYPVQPSSAATASTTVPGKAADTELGSPHDDRHQPADDHDHRAVGAREQEDRRGFNAARQRKEAG